MLYPVADCFGISKVCDKNGDRVSKNNKSSHIFSMRQQVFLVKYEKDSEYKFGLKKFACPRENKANKSQGW